jgi:hypothetical protein
MPKRNSRTANRYSYTAVHSTRKQSTDRRSFSFLGRKAPSMFSRPCVQHWIYAFCFSFWMCFKGKQKARCVVYLLSTLLLHRYSLQEVCQKQQMLRPKTLSHHHLQTDYQCKKRPTSIPEAKRDQDTLKRLNIYRPPMPAGSQTIVSTLLYS